MESIITEIDKLIALAIDYLENKHRFSSSSIESYKLVWRKLKCFMDSLKLTEYSFAVGESYVQRELGAYNYAELSIPQKHFLRRMNALTDFQQTGSILVRRKDPDAEFEGVIGKTMTDLINRNISQGFSLSTIQSYKLYLHQFLAYLTAERIKQLYLINISHIIGFIKSCGNDKLASRHCKLAIIRRFFKFAYDQKLLPIDYSAKIPMSNYTRQSKLPSVYFPQEISALINVIDRGNPKGKRDYAMVLLATRLGLRSSDILGLRFDNIIWEDCRISLNQQKTNTPIDFPLSEEIGSAIIDYLKYARPVSDKPIIFLTLVAPFKELSAPGFANIVQSSLKLAGIDYSKRKRGPHILRHSLASELLKDKIPLPIISEVLGHKNTNSTMYYLRIDIDSLRKCALEVPSISPMFYTRVQNYLSSNK